MLLAKVGRSLIRKAVLSCSPLMGVMRVPVLGLSGVTASATFLSRVRVVAGILRKIVLRDTILVHGALNDRVFILCAIFVTVEIIVIDRLPLSTESGQLFLGGNLRDCIRIVVLVRLLLMVVLLLMLRLLGLLVVVLLDWLMEFRLLLLLVVSDLGLLDYSAIGIVVVLHLMLLLLLLVGLRLRLRLLLSSPLLPLLLLLRLLLLLLKRCLLNRLKLLWGHKRLLLLLSGIASTTPLLLHGSLWSLSLRLLILLLLLLLLLLLVMLLAGGNPHHWLLLRRLLLLHRHGHQGSDLWLLSLGTLLPLPLRLLLPGHLRVVVEQGSLFL